MDQLATFLQRGFAGVQCHVALPLLLFQNHCLPALTLQHPMDVSIEVSSGTVTFSSALCLCSGKNTAMEGMESHAVICFVVIKAWFSTLSL